MTLGENDSNFFLRLPRKHPWNTVLCFCSRLWSHCSVSNGNKQNVTGQPTEIEYKVIIWDNHNTSERILAQNGHRASPRRVLLHYNKAWDGQHPHTSRILGWGWTTCTTLKPSVIIGIITSEAAEGRLGEEVSLDGATLCGGVDGEKGPMEEGWGITIITPAANEPAARRQGHPACLLNADSHYPATGRLHWGTHSHRTTHKARGLMQHQGL